MSEKKDKIFVGGGKTANEDKTWIKATINMAKFEEHIQEFKGHKFLKLNINIYDEADQYGKDVKITIDDYKPDGALGRVESKKAVNEAAEDSDLPF